MSDQDVLNLHRLTQYVNKASDLAESVQADIKHSGHISMKTVECLSDFQKAANRVTKMLAMFEEMNDDIN